MTARIESDKIPGSMSSFETLQIVRLHPRTSKGRAKSRIPYRDLVRDARTQQRYEIVPPFAIDTDLQGLFRNLRINRELLRRIDLGDSGFLGTTGIV